MISSGKEFLKERNLASFFSCWPVREGHLSLGQYAKMDQDFCEQLLDQIALEGMKSNGKLSLTDQVLNSHYFKSVDLMRSTTITSLN